MFGLSGPVLALEEPGSAKSVVEPAAGESRARDSAENPAADPRVGYFVSETEKYGFVLDRTGEKGLLRFDQSVEILVLDMVPGPQGVTYLKDRLGTTILRLMPWGGATVYDADGTEGGAFGFKALVKPLTVQPRDDAYVKTRATEISGALASKPGFEVTFQFEPKLARSQAGVMNSEIQRAPLAMALDKGVVQLSSSGAGDRSQSAGASLTAGPVNDALEVVGLALTRLASDELALEVMSERIARVTIRAGAQQGISLEGKGLVVIYVPERGLFGRPSSAEIERFLLDNL